MNSLTNWTLENKYLLHQSLKMSSWRQHCKGHYPVCYECGQ